MLRSKRQRAGDLGASDDDLARLNPSLMTERQQLAFLLRKTAPASGDSSAQSSESSEDELIQKLAPGARRIQRHVTSRSPRRSGGSAAPCSSVADGENGEDDGAPSHRSRGRLSRTSVKTLRSEVAEVAFKARKVSPREAARENGVLLGSDRRRSRSEKSDFTSHDVRPPPSKKLDVTAAARAAARAAEESRPSSACQHAKKNSPSSSSDVLHMETFESDGSACGSDFWSVHCALCCAMDGSRSARDAVSEALFLCPSCDRKYPTQRALGRV